VTYGARRDEATIGIRLQDRSLGSYGFTAEYLRDLDSRQLDLTDERPLPSSGAYPATATSSPASWPRSSSTRGRRREAPAELR
jgi:hypothetical protein